LGYSKLWGAGRKTWGCRKKKLANSELVGLGNILGLHRVKKSWTAEWAHIFQEYVANSEVVGVENK